MNDLDQALEELEQARDDIDDMIDRIGKAVLKIAYGNAPEAAKLLYEILEDYAREGDAQDVYEQFSYISGIELID